MLWFGSGLSIPKGPIVIKGLVLIKGGAPGRWGNHHEVGPNGRSVGCVRMCPWNVVLMDSLVVISRGLFQKPEFRCTFAIPALGRLRQEDCEFGASLAYRARLCLKLLLAKKFNSLILALPRCVSASLEMWPLALLVLWPSHLLVTIRSSPELCLCRHHSLNLQNCELNKLLL
jgi:hypothetical protein